VRVCAVGLLGNFPLVEVGPLLVGERDMVRGWFGGMVTWMTATASGCSKASRLVTMAPMSPRRHRRAP
jgi:hypothetical protein